MYTRLSTHLQKQLNSKNNKMPSVVKESNTDGGNSFWGMFGSFYKKFINPNKETDTSKMDPITAELARQEKEAEKNAKKREDDLLKAKESAIAQKLAAKYEAKENKATLANKRKVDAWKAKERKAKAAAAYWKKNKLERSESEMNGWYAELEKEFQQGVGTYDSDQEKFQTATTIVAFRKDGTPRTPNEIEACRKAAEKAANNKDYDPQADTELTPDEKTAIAKNDNWKDVGKHVKTMNDLATTHQDAITDSLVNGNLDMTGLMEKVQERATAGEQTTKDAEEATKMAETFKRNKEAVQAFNQTKKTWEEAETKKGELKAAVNKFETNDTGSYIKFDSGTGKPEFNENNFSNLIETIKGKESLNDKQGQDKINAIKSELVASGISQDQVDKLCSKLTPEGIDLGDGYSWIDSINSAYNDADSGIDKEKIKTSVTEQLTKDYNEAKNDLRVQNDKLQNMYNPNEAANSQHNANWIAENGETDLGVQIQMCTNPNYKDAGGNIIGINKEDIDNDTYLNEATENEINNAAAEAQAAAKKVKEEDAARRKNIAIQIAKAEAAEAAESLPVEIQNAIATKKDELGEGEAFCKEEGPNKGKVGYYDENNNFVPKPGNLKDEDTEETQRYIEGRKRALMLKPQQHKLDNITSVADKPETGGDNAGKYKVTVKDDNGGTNEKFMTADEIGAHYAYQSANSQNKSLSDKYKQDAVDVITKKCLENGKIDPAKVKALSDEDKEMFKIVAQLQKDNKLEDTFKGLDLGNISYHDLTTAIGETDLSAVLPPDTTKTSNTADNTTNNTGDDEEDPTEMNNDDYDDDENNDDDGEDIEDEENGEEDEDSNGKKLIRNPAKIWRRRKNKTTGKLTKSYYRKKKNGEWESISKEIYQEKLKKYQKAKNKKSASQQVNEPAVQHRMNDVGGESTIDYTSFRDWLFENVNKTNNYNELKSFLIHQL